MRIDKSYILRDGNYTSGQCPRVRKVIWRSSYIDNLLCLRIDQQNWDNISKSEITSFNQERPEFVPILLTSVSNAALDKWKT